MRDRQTNFLIALGLTIALSAVLVLLTSFIPAGSMAQRILVMLGGSFPSGIIQALTYLLFFFGVLELMRLRGYVSYQLRALNMELLPEKEHYVISADDVAQLRLKMVEVEKQNPLLLVDLIKKACTKFRSNKSVSEALEVVSAQSGINSRESESELELTRYIAWAIPSVGFIGTVIGIAASLGVANEFANASSIGKMTSLLNIAFDTTLVALALSLILMYFFHDLQARLEKMHTQTESYVIENLINRIYHREHA